MTLIPAALTKTIIFPGMITGGYASIASMFVIWIGASLALGRGWCSWGCFFGGLDDAFSRLLKKPILPRIDRRWTYLPWAVLLAVVLTAAAFLSPTYCTWLCPYKAVTEFKEVTSFTILVQTIIFVSLFIALVVVLPLLTKRRIQCSLFCPFGAMQALTNRINAFDRPDRSGQVYKMQAVREGMPHSFHDGGERPGGTALVVLHEMRDLRRCLSLGRGRVSCARDAR